MAYKFTGRIKKIGTTGKNRFCEFDVDNTITIADEYKGVAYDGKTLDVVEEFENIDKEIFNFLQSLHSERFEIEYKKEGKICVIIKASVTKRA